MSGLPQPGSGIVQGHGPQRPVSLVVELGEFANHVRVQAAALAWNLRGARVNTISPTVTRRSGALIAAASPQTPLPTSGPTAIPAGIQAQLDA